MTIKKLKTVTTFCRNALVVSVILLTGWFTIGAAKAQDIYRLRKVDLPPPFKYSEIRNMRQDDDGYIWFTTSQGLWRYDGTDVEAFDAHDPQLPPSAVPDVFYCYHGYLLLFYYPNGCKMYAYDTHTAKLTKFVLNEYPLNFFIGPQQKLSFYTNKIHLWEFSRDSMLQKIKNNQGITGWIDKTPINNFRMDDDGSLYVFYKDQIAKIKNGQLYFSPDTTVEVHGDKKIKFIFERDVLVTSKYLFAKYSNGFAIYDKKKFKKVYEYRGTGVSLALVLNDGFVIIKNGDDQLQADTRYFRTQPSPFTGVANVVRTYLPEAGTNSCFVATDKGLFELTPNLTNNSSGGENDFALSFLKNKSIRCIYRLQNGKLYAGTYNGFYAITNNSAQLVNNLVIYTIKQVDNNTLLLGIEGGAGFATLDIATDKLHLMNDAGLYHNNIYGFCFARDGDSYIAGAGYGLYRLKKQGDGQWHFKQFFHADSLGDVKQVSKINNSWYVASTTGLFEWRPDNTVKRIFPLHDKYTIYAMQPDGDGIWLGTAANGLIKIDTRGRILNQIRFSNGLAGEFVYSLFETNGLLFAGTNVGLSVFDTNAGMQAITPPDDPQYSEELNHSAIFYDDNRRQLILGGVQGLLLPDMAHYSSAKIQDADVVKLSYVKKGSNGVDLPETNLFAYTQKEIMLDPGYVFMGFKFSVSNIWRQGGFLFRVPELDTLWHKSNLGNEISFYGLAPGKYTLQARFPSVSSPRYWLSKTIIVVPHFYQTILFKLLIGLVIALMIYVAWLYRAQKIRGEHMLRTTIASDLHDEIGSALTRISMTSELMNIKQQLDTRVVERISIDSKNAIASISDIIWSVDARNDTTDDLLLRMKEHAYNMLDEVAEVHFETDGLDKVVVLPQLVRQNLYLIFKEAINNIARHNNKPKVWIQLNNQLSGLTIVIKNTIDLRKNRTAFAGQGLKNIRMRAKRMKAEVQISNTDDLFTVMIKMKRW